MNVILHKPKALFFVVLAILMTACLERQMEPIDNETPPETGEIKNGIPDDFEYETKSTHKLTVKVKDKYNGERYYTVEVFMANPIADASAKFLGGAQTNKNTPFEMDIVIPKIQKKLFVRLTDPKGFRFVTDLDVKEGDLLLDYNETDTKTKSALRGTFDTEEPADYPTLFQAGLKNAKEVTAANSDLKAGGIYKITDKNFDEEVTFPKGKVVLYIDEGCSLKLTGKNKNVELTDGSEIYILEDASIIGNSAEFTVGDNSKIYNAGTLDLKSISLAPANTTLYNHPASKISLQTLTLNGGNVYNHCLMTVSDVVFTGTGSNLFLRVNSSMNVSNMKFNEGHAGCGIHMQSRAFLHVNKFHKQTSSALQIYGEVVSMDLEDLPLLQVEGDMKCSSVLVYWNILLDTKGHTEGIVAYSSTGVKWLDGDIPTNMQGSCYTVQNNPDDKDFTEESDSPVYDPQDKESSTYIYMFEDNWPGVGDYDMNDVVINIGVMNRMSGSNATTAIITGDVIAVGAKKDLYVFAQIDGTDKIVDLLGSEVHAFMGMPSSETINTYKSNCEAKSFVLEVDVTGMKGLVNANNLNVFIVWGEPAGNKRNEIHVAGFHGTKQAAISTSSTKDYKYISDDEFGNLMWGLMIPKDNYSSYPKEGEKIKDAYPGFLDWAKSGGQNAVDWYTSGVEDKVFKTK